MARMLNGKEIGAMKEAAMKTEAKIKKDGLSNIYKSSKKKIEPVDDNITPPIPVQRSTRAKRQIV